jgi:tRNA threonylcarbamoyladenosine biosynthesis protein TsaE
VTPRLELSADSPEETRGVGRAVASVLGAGDVVSLTGDLGAGKTTFVQGAAAGLGIEQPVLSPTFTLVHEYQATHPVFHLDVYRLDRLQEVLDLGFEEMLDRGGVMFIEWGDVIEALLPESYLQVELSLRDDEEERRDITVSGRGRSWAERWDRLAEAMSRWTRLVDLPRREERGPG